MYVVDINYKRGYRDICFFSFNLVMDFFGFDGGYMYKIY